MTIKRINPPSLYDGAPFGMSQATIDSQNGLLFISGQVDWGSDYKIRSEGIEAQTLGAINNLLSVLKEANASANDILHVRVLVRGELSEHMEKIVPIIADTLGKNRPALTGLGVASLATPDTLIEIEAIASVH